MREREKKRLYVCVRACMCVKEAKKEREREAATEVRREKRGRRNIRLKPCEGEEKGR